MIDLTDSREVFLLHSDKPAAIRHYVWDIPVSADGRIDSYHARFSKTNILCVQGDIATVPALMKEVPGN